MKPFDFRVTGRPGRRCVAAVLAGAVALLLVVPAAWGTVVPWLALSEMTAGAQVIVSGTVESSESLWSEDGRIIVTRTSVRVDRALKGGPRSRVIVEAAGGKVADQAMIAAGAPVFRAGERVILFLEPAGGAGAARHAVVGWNQGRMSVRRDPRTGRDLVEDRTGGALYVDRQGRPVGPGRAGKGPAALEDFLREVERLVASGPPAPAP